MTGSSVSAAAFAIAVAATLCVAIAVLAVLAWRHARLCVRVTRQAEEIERLGRDLANLLKCERGVTSRMRENEAQLVEIARAQRRLMNADRDALSVEHVKRLLARGSSVEEIVGTSELSTTELELLAAMARREGVPVAAGHEMRS